MHDAWVDWQNNQYSTKWTPPHCNGSMVTVFVFACLSICHWNSAYYDLHSWFVSQLLRNCRYPFLAQDHIIIWIGTAITHYCSNSNWSLVKLGYPIITSHYLAGEVMFSVPSVCVSVSVCITEAEPPYLWTWNLVHWFIFNIVRMSLKVKVIGQR